MARRDDLDIFALKYNMVQVYISDLVEYRMANESLVEIISTEKEIFFDAEVKKIIFQDHKGNKHTVIQFGELETVLPVKFHIIDTDINLFLTHQKLYSMLNAINYLKSNNGILVFLESKDERKEHMKDFGIGAQIIKKLNINRIKLLTSGTKTSFVGINGFGLKIEETIVIE
jgi:3,4-dihydroxy 2-butanone 4-phosphate synthase/GTP cyclohydrolase II